MICHPCIALPCVNTPDLASGIDGAIYSALDYSFIVQCPTNCYCPPGLFPQTISILASTIPPVVPPIPEPGAPIILHLQGCTALITRTLDSTATQAQIIAAAQSMQAEWAGQQALCNAMTLPGVNCLPGANDFINVCNDASTQPCSTGPVSIPAGVRCTTLQTLGLTQAQIDAAVALIKASLNQQEYSLRCPYFCPIAETFFGGGNTTTVMVHNVGATNFDSSSFQLCDSTGAGCFNSVVPLIAPGVNANVISASPFTISCTVKFQGRIIFSDGPNLSGLNRFFNIVANC
jgi:hypothetical protein